MVSLLCAAKHDVPPHAPTLGNKVVVRIVYRYVRDVGEGVFFCYPGYGMRGGFFALGNREFEAAIADTVYPAETLFCALALACKKTFPALPCTSREQPHFFMYARQAAVFKCGEEVIPELIRCIEKQGKQDQIIFIAFDWKTIVATHKAFPKNKCYWLSSSKTAVKKRIPEVAAEGLTGINLNYSIIDDEVMALAKENKLEVLAWTVDKVDEAKRLTSLGVTGLTTNRPKWLKEEMGK